MTHRQFFWGLSNGAIVLAAGGFFWLGLAMSTLPRTQPFFLVLVGGLGLIVYGAMRVRRNAEGFRPSELQDADARVRQNTRRMMRGFHWTAAGQGALVGIAVYACLQAGRQDLIWPWIALILSLHFLPLARVFHVPLYYATGLAGAIVSGLVLVAPGSWSLAFLGVGMGAIMWLTSIYIVRNAARIVAAGVERFR